MGKQLVLIGGGHAHMVTLAGIGELVSRGHRVTVVGPSEYHYYSGMGPGMLGGTYSPEEIRFATRQVVEKQGGTFVLDYVTGIDPAAHRLTLASGTAIDYDVLSCNAGSQVPLSLAGEDRSDIFSVKPIEKLTQARSRILELAGKGPLEIGIVGGGPSSAEIAGNILQLIGLQNSTPPRIRIFAGSSFMHRFPEPVRRRIRNNLRRRKVEIVEGSYVREVKTGSISLKNERNYRADLIFLAVGVKPSPIFGDSGLEVGPDGGLLVNRYLQSPNHPDIFGGGDCIYFREEPLDKVGVYAVRQNPVLYHNLRARLEGGALQPFESGGEYLLIFNLGENRGVLHKGRLTFDGRLAFLIKDYIDRRFMRRFQALESE